MPVDLRCRWKPGARPTVRATPRPEGGPRESGLKAAPRARKQELEERVCRLETRSVYIYLPVTLSGHVATCSGVPAHTMRPPRAPPPGPMSTM